MRRAVRRLLVTLPFEADAYRAAGVDVVYVGHPAADRIPRPPSPRREVALRARRSRTAEAAEAAGATVDEDEDAPGGPRP